MTCPGMAMPGLSLRSFSKAASHSWNGVAGVAGAAEALSSPIAFWEDRCCGCIQLHNAGKGPERCLQLDSHILELWRLQGSCRKLGLEAL